MSFKRLYSLTPALVWQLASMRIHHPIMPDVLAIGAAFVRITPGIFPHLGASLLYLSYGYFSSVILGISSGILLYAIPAFQRAVMPFVDGVRSVAALAVFPLFVLLLGTGLLAKSAVIFWTAYPAMMISTIGAMASVDKSIQEAAFIDGASQFQNLILVVLPNALPLLLNGAKVAAGAGWISLIAAEMLGSNEGLGFLVLNYSQTFKFPELYAAIVYVAITGIALNAGIDYLIQHGDLTT